MQQQWRQEEIKTGVTVSEPSKMNTEAVITNTDWAQKMSVHSLRILKLKQSEKLNLTQY